MVDVCTEPSRSAKKGCVWQPPQFLLPGKELRLNRISHPDWMKLCVELDYALTQNTKILSTTYVYKQDLALNNLQELICLKIPVNQL